MQSNSHLFHISSNFLLLCWFHTDVGFPKYLKKQNKLKKLVKIVAFKMSTGTFITLFLSFYKLKSLLTTFFIPDKKWVGPLWCLLSLNFAATGVVVISFQVSTLKFSLPATKIHHQTRGKLQRGKKLNM